MIDFSFVFFDSGPNGDLVLGFQKTVKFFWLWGGIVFGVQEVGKLGGAELGLKIWDKLMRLAWVAIEEFGFEVERVND
jgi:hypothetical protein